jgi:hypothetical protein
MKPFEPDDYDHYSTKPVPCDPWDPYTKAVARQLLADLEQTLEGLDVELRHMGSTALEIPGKNEVEVYVFPASGFWDRVTETLTGKYGEPGYHDTEFIRYDTKLEGYDIELIQVRGYTGKLNRAVYQHLSENPAVCDDYVVVKRQYRFSKREYQRHKDQFFATIVRQIPEDYVTS